MILLVAVRVLVLVTKLDTMIREVIVRLEGMMEVVVVATVVVITRSVVKATVQVLVVRRVVERVRVTVTVHRACAEGAINPRITSRTTNKMEREEADLAHGGGQFILVILVECDWAKACLVPVSDLSILRTEGEI